MIAYLTCELKARDLDSRVLLAAHLLDRGIACVVGQQWSIWGNLDHIPKGCLVATGGSAVHAHNMKRAKSFGHAVVMSDEEALALVSEPHLVANVTREAFDACEVFLAQSESHAGIVREAFPRFDKRDPLGQRGNVRITGSPRADLLTERGRKAYADDAKDLCGGERFILFNSNFALDHYVWGDIDQVTPEIAQQHGLRLDMLAWERENKRLMLKLIDWCVANLPDHRIVIRPHPAERSGAWKKAREKSSRIVIVEGSSPIPWLLAADVVVHTNCTTGLEAAMLGRPCVNLSPDPEAEWHKAFITPMVNRTVASVERAADEIAYWATAEEDLWTDQPIDAHLPGWRTATASTETASLIAGLLSPTPNGSLKGMTWTPHARNGAEVVKFSVTRSEVETRLGKLAEAFDLCSTRTIGTRQLDDSTVLMVPK